MHDLELTSLRARTDADCSMSELAVAAEAAPAETPNTARRVRLGRTDLEVTRIGIGCGNGINNADLQYAISRGVNYIFTSSDMHADDAHIERISSERIRLIVFTSVVFVH